MIEAPKVERRRRENRGAVGAEGVRCVEGVSLSPLGRGLGKGQCPCPENFLIADLKVVSFDAFCVVFKILDPSVNT